MRRTRPRVGGRGHRWRGLGVILAIWTAFVSPAQAQGRLYIEIFDQQTGAIVTDLQETEVVVREDGVVRAVKGGAKLDHDGGGKLDHLAAGRSV